MGRVVQQLLRHDQPVTMAIRRFPLEDVEVGGRCTALPEGHGGRPRLASANFDPERFADAEQLDLARDPNPHLAFGLGPHYCLGAPLARLEARIALWTLFRRYPALRLGVAPGELRWQEDHRQRGLLDLPVRLTA